MTAERSEAERWHQAVASLYSRVAASYAEHGPPFFVHAGRRLVELADVRPGDAVLDVGTGRGAVLLPAARRVGVSGRALGIDLAPGMVESTRAAIARDGLTQASVELMDAEDPRLEAGTFTHVLGSFSVFFFMDVAKTVRTLRTALRAGGRIGFAFSRGTDSRWTWLRDLMERYAALEGLPASGGQEAIRDPGALKSTLEAIGFAAVEEIEEPHELFYATPSAWWASLWTHGTRRALEHLQPDVLSRLEAEALAQAQTLAGPSGVPDRMHFVYVLGRNPS